jgi:histidyl-tRNA synthetase
LALDKRGKISDDEMILLLEKEGLSKSNVERAFQLLGITSLEKAAALLKDEAPLKNLHELFHLMDHCHMRDFLAFDLSIIRGLDYYTGIVFEAFDVKNKFRAIFGGGRYDNLLSALGGRRIPSVGLGFGDVVICEILDHLGIQRGDESGLDVLVGYMSLAEQSLALKGTSILRQAGKTVNLQLKPLKAKKLFSTASKAGARYAIYIGPSEAKEGTLAVKDLSTGHQLVTVPERLPEVVK